MWIQEEFAVVYGLLRRGGGHHFGKPRTTFDVRGRLLDEEEGFISYVRSHLGNTVEAVIKACLQGPQAFGLPEEVDEKKGEVGAALQRGFYEKVVKQLGQMRI